MTALREKLNSSSLRIKNGCMHSFYIALMIKRHLVKTVLK